MSAVTASAEDPLLVAPTEPLSAQQQREMFHLPPGFEIQLVAAEPEIRKPMNLAFDAKGRLWATQSVEYPYPCEGPDAPRDTIRVFDDIGRDGRAHRITVFADGLNIPIGLAPTLDGAIAYDIPNIRKFTDDDGDGAADRREVLFTGFGHRDTHGMSSSYRPWIDGWTYGCHGYLNDSAVRGAQGEPIVMNSGNTYRFRKDGSAIEYFTHGQVNPFGMAFDALGNLYSADCHTLPAYMLLRGAWYPSFGKPHDGLGFGPEMMAHYHGSTGIAGIVHYEADHFPPEYRQTLFIGNPVTGRVNHDRLEPRGSSYWALEQPDFIRCDDPWFRPVDIQLGPDGALYIADFYNCIIGHYEVPLTHPRRDRERGRIWRVVYRGPDGQASPQAPGDLATAPLQQLIALLGHPNLTVRVMATNVIVERWGSQALPLVQVAMATSDDPRVRAHALWIVERLSGLDKQQAFRLISDPDRLVRVHMIKALAERRRWDDGESEMVLAALGDEDPFARRAAADALGRHPDKRYLVPLLRLWQETPQEDSHLVHVARMALRDLLLVPAIFDHARVLGDQDARHASMLADVSLGIADSRSAAYLVDALRAERVPPEKRAEAVRHAIRHAADDRMAGDGWELCKLIAPADAPMETPLVLALYRGFRERGAPLPEAIKLRLTRLVSRKLEAPSSNTHRGELLQGLELARELNLEGCQERVLALMTSGTDLSLRSAAVETLVAVAPGTAVPFLEQIAANGNESIELRSKAAEALASLRQEDALLAADRLFSVVPQEVARGLARGMTLTHDGVERLLARIGEGKASPELLREATVSQRAQIAPRAGTRRRVQQLLESLPPADASLDALIAQRREFFASARPSPEAGKEVFVRRCAICHRLGGEGIKIGPELDGVGVRGPDRLLEDILNVNANVDQAFRTTLVTTRDGRVVSGLTLREEGETLLLANAEGKEMRFAIGDIEERRETPLSPMPANFGEVIPETELADLVEYLLRQKAQ